MSWESLHESRYLAEVRGFGISVYARDQKGLGLRGLGFIVGFERVWGSWGLDGLRIWGFRGLCDYPAQLIKEYLDPTTPTTYRRHHCM